MDEGSLRSKETPNNGGMKKETKEEEEEQHSRQTKKEGNRKSHSSESASRSHRNNKTHHHDHRQETNNKDREAKYRGRRNEAGSSVAPGAIAFKGEHSSSRNKQAKDHHDHHHHHRHRDRLLDEKNNSLKKHHHHRHTTVPGAVRSTEAEDEHEKPHAHRHHHHHHHDSLEDAKSSSLNKKHHHHRHTAVPGAVRYSNEEEDARIISSKSSKGTTAGDAKRRSGKPADRPGAKQAGPEDLRSVRKESRNEYKKKQRATVIENNNQIPAEGDGSALIVAETLVEGDEERFQRYDQREANNMVAANDDDEAHVEEKAEDHTNKGRKHKTLFFFFCLCCCLILLVGGATVGGLYAAGILSFSSEEAASGLPEKVLDNVTVTPTEAPQVKIPDVPKSDSPSSAPTFFVYDPVSPDQCAAIANGDNVDGQENMIEKSFALILDSQLSVDTEPPILLETMHQKIQEILAPKMAGCDDDAISRRRHRRHRSLNARDHDEYKYIVGNLVVIRVVETGEECSPASAGTICLGMQVEIGIFVRGDELKNIDYIGKLSAVFNGDSNDLAIELELNQNLFQKVLLVKLVTLDPTAAPTIAPTLLASEGPTTYPTPSPSIATPSPTFMPVSFATTEKPTGSPSVSPTVTTPSPTQAPTTPAPSVAPSSTPSLRPSVQPAPGVTPIPTSLPSAAPSMGPTIGSSAVPSSEPSRAPSKVPSLQPSEAPSGTPSLRPSMNPSTPQPSTAPSVLTREARIDSALTAAGYDSGNRNADAYTWLTQTDTWEHETSSEGFHWVERYVLAILYKQCNGANWNNQENWLNSAFGVCDWQHVSACDDDGRIKELYLRFADDVTAPLPMELISLESLVTMEFQGDTIAENGKLPPAITQLSKLERLVVAVAGITSVGPEVAPMTSLKHVDFSTNNLDDGFPPGILLLTNLEELGMEKTYINAPLPPEISALSNLKLWKAEYPGLKGPMPQEFFQLPNFEKFDCHRCFGFGGTLQTEWASMPNLKHFTLSFASLVGTIPSELLNLSQMTHLALFRNSLAGSIPPLPSSLDVLSLANNNLGGTIPPLPSPLTICHLDGNSFTDTTNAIDPCIT